MDDHVRRERAEVTAAIGDHQLYAVYQPIVDLGSGAIAGFEACVRCRAGARTPDAWLDQARRVGLGVDLELAAVQEALDHAPPLPLPAFVAVNCSAALLASPQLPLVLARTSRPVVLEIAEHDRDGDYDALRTAMAQLREHGVRLSIEEAGAGFSSLTHILRVVPDYVKISAALTRGIDTDAVRRSLTKALVALAAETGAVPIAVGIDSRSEYETLRSLGVRLGQGDYIAPPQPPGGP